MPVREAVAKSALERMLLAEIRAQAGCEDVVAVAVTRVADRRCDVNWKVSSIGYGARGSEVADRAAEQAQHKLQHRFMLE
jgi:3'-phosphoadenosine 5'-phosphosulfate sulfotransferase